MSTAVPTPFFEIHKLKVNKSNEDPERFIEYVVQPGSITEPAFKGYSVRRYVGEGWKSTDLAHKASLGLWHASAISSWGYLGLEGEGPSPVEAVNDLRSRAIEMVDHIRKHVLKE